MTSVFINEFHYDNTGTDAGEFIEIAGPAGTDLADWAIVLYNGSNGTTYDTINLSGTLSDDSNGFGFVVETLPTNGLQNGSPDGIALVDSTGTVVEFLSYEGCFTATNGPASGQTSVDIGVSETGSTSVGDSLQRTGTGATATDFAFVAPSADTPGAANTGQTFTGGTSPVSVFISEIHYDNAGADTGEFIEVMGDAGVDLAGYSLVLYNGSNGTVYDTETLAGVFTDENNGQGALAFDISGIQNGSPDGVALVDPNGTVVEFLSYEGVLTATDGPASGQTSTDIGVSEPSNTAIGDSLQLIDGIWIGPAASTKGEVNAAPSVSANAFISEIHYDNDGADVGEFIEITANAGADLSGYSLVLYNGNGGGAYNTVALSGTVPSETSTPNNQGALAFRIAGIQNGAPDGVALVDPDGNVVEFLSYEGTFTATDGPAAGLTSTDIGVTETSSTPVGQSLQLVDGIWIGPAANSEGFVNSDNNGGSGPAESKFIHEVQSSGDASPLVGQTVTVEAVVVGDFQNGDADSLRNLEGFYLQEEDADADGDSSTSEGLFIFEDGNFLTDVSVGDVVRVTGTVEEAFDQTQLSVTSASDITVLSSGNALPTAATVNFPVATVDSLEAFEGMQVTIPDTLFVTEYFNLDRFGEVVLSANGASNAPGTDGRLDQYTQFNAPDVAGFSVYQQAIAQRRVVLDDGQFVQNPDPIIHGRGGNPLSANNTLRGGDTVNNLSGILGFGFGDYRIQPTAAVDFQATNPRPSTPEPVGGDLTVVSFNVLNFFTTLDVSGNPGSGPSNLSPRGADSQAEFDRQLEKLVTTLAVLDADVVGLIEIENEFGGDQNGDGQFAIDTLVNALNAEVGAGTYAFVEPGQTFVDVSDAISVGAIYKTSTVQLAQGTSVEILDDSDLGGLGLNFGNAVFDGPSTNRAALAATFEEKATGAKVTVAVNHFKSKGSVSPGPGNTDAGDGAGNNNAIRLQAAQALDAWLDSDPTGSGDSDYLIIGDLNAYAKEDPITFLESEGYTNVVDNPESAYSFVFDGQFGTLDYGLASSTLISQVTGATEWHVNADEPDALDYNLDFGRDPSLFDGTVPFRNSDHDPLIIGLDLTSGVPSIDRINDYTIFSREVNGKSFVVNLIDNEPVYSVDGSEVSNPSVNSFLSAAVAELGGSVDRNGTIKQGGLEHFGSNRNPAIRQRDRQDDVIISGSGVGGQYLANFDNDATADAFEEFADDLLGRDPAKTQIFGFRGNTNGGANRIQVFVNDEITGLNSEVQQGLATPNSLEFRWSGADARGRQRVNNQDDFWEAMGPLFDGVQLRDGQVTGFGTQNQARLVGAELNRVDFGASGIGGKEVWEFDDQRDAQNFLNLFEGVVDAIGAL
ncbi:MAG: ExeM/NucH family extracellular endonuclease [Cyanobacteria bacterium P01_D01_bin.1]